MAGAVPPRLMDRSTLRQRSLRPNLLTRVDVITPRQTRLFRTADLATFRRTILSCVAETSAWDRRASAVIVPSHAAADQLRWTFEQRALTPGAAQVFPLLVTRDELYAELHRRAASAPPLMGAIERLVCGRAAADEALASGMDPPFRLRPGLVSEFLGLYDELQRRHRSVDTFERLLVDELDPNAEFDRGARRMLRQTRFLAAMFRAYERRVGESGRLDEHGLRRLVLDQGLHRPLSHLVVTVADRAADADGLWSGDYDLLSRLPGLARIDLVTTATLLDTGFRERLSDMLPGVDETGVEGQQPSPEGEGLRLVVPDDGSGRLHHLWRDREEELLAIVRQVKRRPAHERTAVVFQRPLPYLYLAGQIFPSAGVPYETRDTLPLAAEPFAAALDLVLSFVASGFARQPLIELLRSPHLHFEQDGQPLEPEMVRALDRALFEARYGGERDELHRLSVVWGAAGRPRREAAAVPAARVAASAADALDELTREGESSRLLECLLRFLADHRARPPADPDTSVRESRGRAAVVGIIDDLRDAHLRHDDPVTDLPGVTSTLRRLIEGATFAAPSGTDGVILVDADAARYGEFDNVFLVGLLDGEWPERRRQSSLFPASLLSQLGWSRDIERLRAARAGLSDLLRLAANRVSVSTVAFEDDAVVAGSALLEDLEDAGLSLVREASPVGPVTAEAGLAERPDAVTLPVAPTEWLGLRRGRGSLSLERYRGITGPRAPAAYAVSAVERYLSCPFKYFAASVLRLGDEPDDELIMAPRTRGRFVHEVLRAFFERWQRDGSGPIDVERLDEARTMARALADEHLAMLPPPDRAVERVWLLGSPAGMGVIDRLLALEADRPGRVIERLLEYRFDGEYQLDGEDGPRTVRLRGIADRIDLLEGGRLRVIDYKTGRAPTRGQALQLPVYGRCAEQELDGRHGTTWDVDSAAYVAFGEPRAWAPLDRRRDIGAVMLDGQQQFLAAVDQIEQGQFQVRPTEPYRCVYCEYPTVCRKDYVGDD